MKRILALSALLVCVFAVPVLAAYQEWSNAYGRAYLNTESASGLRKCSAGTIRMHLDNYAYVSVTTIYEDGTDSTYSSGHVVADVVRNQNWEDVDTYHSKHIICETLPYDKLWKTFSD